MLGIFGLKFRSIGPALMSGRISDIVIHPENENVWYVTAGSGGVWKTENPSQAAEFSIAKGISIKKCHILTPLEKLCFYAQMRVATLEIAARRENHHFLEEL